MWKVGNKACINLTVGFVELISAEFSNSWNKEFVANTLRIGATISFVVYV